MSKAEEASVPSINIDLSTTLTRTLDVYAKPYIPQALISVNRTPATVISTTPLPGIDFETYVRSFAGKVNLIFQDLRDLCRKLANNLCSTGFLKYTKIPPLVVND